MFYKVMRRYGVVLLLAAILAGTGWFLFSRTPRGYAGFDGKQGDEAYQPVTFKVNSFLDAVDSLPGDGLCATSLGDCTLRAAVQESNALAGMNTIQLPLGVYLLTISGAGEDQAAKGDLDLLGDTAIMGMNDFEIYRTAVIDGGGLDRVFDLIGVQSTYLSNLTIQNGLCQNCEGGGIRTWNSNLWLTGTNIVGNSAAYSGGGVFSLNGSLQILNSAIGENQSGVGGGVYHQGGPLSIEHSTIDHNIAGNSGGGLFTNREARLTNTTLSNNHAEINGGGIYHEGTVLLNHVTLAQNSANGMAGGIYTQVGYTTTITSTLLAQNTAPSGADCTGRVDSGGYNLVGTLDGCSYTSLAGDLSGVDPLLGPLQDNGNYASHGQIGGGTPGMFNTTRTRALSMGSPAIDAGVCVTTTYGTIEPDQRYYERPQDGDDDGVSACDIGAYEAPRRTWGTFDLTGVLGGVATNIDVRENYAYLAVGSQIQVYNITNPQLPAFVNQVSLNALAARLVVSGTLAYVSDGNYGLHILDLSNPAQPHEIGAWLGLTPDWEESYALVVQGQTVYMGTYGGMRVIDASNPEQPVMVGSLLTPGIGSLVVSGNYAYASDYPGIRVIDVHDPLHPVSLASFALSDETNQLALAGGYLYFTAIASNNDRVMRIYDLANPALPAPRGTYTITNGSMAWNLAVDGDRVFLAEDLSGGPGGIRIVSVADPDYPTALGFWDSPGFPRDISPAGSLVYLADDTGGLRVVNVQNPGSVTQVGAVPMIFNSLHSLAVSGRFAALNDASGLKIVDLAKTPLLQINASLPLTGTSGEIEWQGDFAYLIRGSSLAVADLTTSLLPQKRGIFTAPETLGDVIVDGGMAFVSGASGLRVLDVTDKNNLIQLSFLSLPDMGDWNDNLAVEDNYVYLMRNYSLYIVDATNPNALVQKGVYNFTSGYPHGDFTVSGGYAFVNGFILDVSNPDSPVLVTKLSLFGGASWSEKVYDINFQTASGNGFSPSELQAFDVRSPGTPGKMGSSRFPLSWEQDADQSGGFSGVVDENALALLRMSLHTIVTPSQSWQMIAPGHEARLAFPVGSVNDDAQVSYSPLLLSSHPLGNLAYAGAAFQLSARLTGGNQVTAFKQPVTVTVTYTDAALAGMDEAELKLYRWNGTWQDAAESCVPARLYARDPDHNELSVPICHLSEYALLGPSSGVLLQLPLLVKSYPLTYNLTGRVTLSGGAGLAGVSVQTQMGHTTVTTADGSYTLTGVTAGTYTLTPSKPGYAFTPPDRTVDVPAQISGLDFAAEQTVICSELLVNGNFETNSGWTILGSTYPADYVSTPVHAGSGAMRTGILRPGDNRTSFSAFRQDFTLVSSPFSAVLRVWLYPSTTETQLTHLWPGWNFPEAAADSQYIRLLQSDNTVLATLFSELSNSLNWGYHEYNLAPYAGQNLRIVFGSYNNGTGGVTGLVVDDASIEVCK